MIFEVTYELHAHDHDYAAVENALRTATSSCHPQNSVWLIDTLESVSEWRDRLQEAGDPRDEILVTRLHGHEWATNTTSPTGLADWMKDNARRW